MVECKGNIKNDHCCWVDGKVCLYLKHYLEQERKWSCSIREKYNSWDEVYADEDYIQKVKPLLDKNSIPNCGEWPRKDEICVVCGVIG